MKKQLMAVCCVLFNFIAFCQDNSKEYTALINKGKAHYKAKDYIISGQTFSSAFQLTGARPSSFDRWAAACSWSLGKSADSAFAQLDLITKSNDLTFWDVDQISTDEDFTSLFSDNRWENVKNKLFAQLNRIVTSTGLTFSEAPNYVDTSFEPSFQDIRWQELKDNLFLNIYNGFLTTLKQKGLTFSPSATDQLTFARALYANPDSAFTHLNDPAIIFLNNKLFDKAYMFIEASNIIFPNNYRLTKNMGDYHLAKGEKEKAFDFYSIALQLKHHDPAFLSSTRNIDSTITIDYAELFKQTGHLVKHPPKRILIDEGHFEFHTLSGSFDELAVLMRKDGYTVMPHTAAFNLQSLIGIDILILSNPGPQNRDTLNRRAKAAGEPFRWYVGAIQSAFTDAEVTVIKNWVSNGGSLFLIIDHAPTGASNSTLAAAFGVETRNVETWDSLQLDPIKKNHTILFTRERGTIGSHPILNGVDSVITYGGESLLGSKGSAPLLLFTSAATDRDWISATREYRIRSAAGRAQGIAVEYGLGRVVVLGEAGMITSNPATNKPGPGKEGIGRSDRGNMKFVMNILNWLARVN